MSDTLHTRTLSLHYCKICGVRWLLWPDAIHGGGWNLLDRYQRPGSCCDNAAMGEQIEHLRDFDISSPVAVKAALLLAKNALEAVLDEADPTWRAAPSSKRRR